MKFRIIVLFCCLHSAVAGADSFKPLLDRAYGYGAHTYGMYAYAKEEKEKTFAAFTVAIEKDPQLARAHFHRGDCLFEQGKFAEAEACYIESLRLDSHQVFAFYNLACLHARTGKPTKAIEDLENAFRLGYDRFEKLLGDSDLASIHDDPALATLIARFRSQSAEKDLVAGFQLSSLDEKSALLDKAAEEKPADWQRLADAALFESEFRLRIEGLALYRRFGGIDALPVLVRGLFDNNGYVNKYAGNALAATGADALPYVDAILASDFEDAKFYAKQIKALIERPKPPQ